MVPSKNLVQCVSGQPPQHSVSMVDDESTPGPYSPKSISLYGCGDGTCYTKEKRCPEAEGMSCFLLFKYHHHDFCTFQIVMMSLEQQYVVYHTPNHLCINILMHTLTWKYFCIQSHR